MPSSMQKLSRWLLRVCGWRMHGPVPAARSFILVAAPHTSNWDLLWLLLMTRAAGIRISWLAKHSLFRGPLGWCLRRLGGVPVIRHRSEDRVAGTVRAFAAQPDLVLVIPPEATRARAEFWRSGFYHIARLARVPVIPTALDYGRRSGEFGPAFDACEDVGAFMDDMRAFYSDRAGRHPAQFGPVRLQEEASAQPETRREPERISEPEPESAPEADPASPPTPEDRRRAAP